MVPMQTRVHPGEEFVEGKTTTCSSMTTSMSFQKIMRLNNKGSLI